MEAYGLYGLARLAAPLLPTPDLLDADLPQPSTGDNSSIAHFWSEETRAKTREANKLRESMLAPTPPVPMVPVGDSQVRLPCLPEQRNATAALIFDSDGSRVSNTLLAGERGCQMG